MMAAGTLFDLALKSTVIFGTGWLITAAMYRASSASRHAVWAAEAQSNLFDTPLPDDLPTDAAFDTAEPIRALFMGDAVQRAVAIHALSGERYYRQEPPARLWVLQFLSVNH